MCLTTESPQITRSTTTSTPYYTTDIPCVGFARVDEPSHPPPGQIPTTSPVCAIGLLDVLTTCIVDNACVYSNITTGALQRLFPNRWQRWIKPTKEALDSATHHPLKIIGKLVKAKIQLGTIELEQDIQIVEDNEPRFLVGNDIIFDRITIHESRFITVRCSKEGVAREIIPIQYGAPLMFGVLSEDVIIKPSSGMEVQLDVQIDPRAANRVNNDYVNRLQGQDISLENIRYGPDAEPDCPIQVEEVICTLAKSNKAVIIIVNPTFTKIKLAKGTRLARVSPIERQGAYFVQTQTPQLLSEMFNKAGENIELQSGKEDEETSSYKTGCRTPTMSSPMQIEQQRMRGPQALYLHSHDEDIKNLMQGAEDGEMPLPAGYELPELAPDRKEYKISDLKTPYLSESQRTMILAVCNRHKEAFAQHDKDVGCCQYEEHDLDVGDSPPVAQPYRPCPRAYVEEATKIIDNMLELDIIEESDSEFGQNLVIVKKPSGALRLCVDLRPINALLVPSSKPAWPIPHVEESFEKFAAAEFVSKLDLTNAYWCLKLTPRSRKVTAFYFLNRLYHFKRAPFGAANLPSVFARVMSKMLRGMRSFSWSFFDDIAIMSTDFESHLIHLEKVLKRIEEAGFKIRADKCRICVPKSQPLDWLGHIVCNGQLLCDPKKVKAIVDTPEPKNVDEVIKYVSALNFMSRHYPWFAQVVIPLYNMKVKANKGEPFHFGEVEQEAFQLSKQMAVHAPALQLPRHDAELIITSDASTEAAAGMLSMRITDPETGEMKEVACGYVSRRFTEAERKRKSVPECEMTALIFTITAFSYYLVGRASFVVRTDASSLLYLHKFKEANPRLMRAALWLQEYSFTIEHMKYSPGNTMALADFMSRAYEHAPMVTLSWNNLRNRVFNQLTPQPNWPKRPLNKTEFSQFADLFFESFEPEFSEDTEPLEKLKIQYFLNPSKERQRELDTFQKKQLKGKQKQRYLVIKEKLRSIASDIEETSDKTSSYNIGTVNAEPPSETRTDFSFSQESEHLRPSEESEYPITQEDEESVPVSSTESGDADTHSETSSERIRHWNELTTLEEDFGNELANMLLVTTPDQGGGHSEALANSELEKHRQENNHIWPHCLHNKHPLQIMRRGLPNATTETSISVPGQGLTSPREMASLQRLDPELIPEIKKLQDAKDTQPSNSKYKFKEGVLTFQRQNKDGTTQLAVVIPFFMRKSLMKHIHGDGIGGPHLGSKLMFLAMRPYYHWPHMQGDVEAFCKGCLSCIYTRPSTVKQVGLKHRSKAPLVRPNQRLAVDLIVGLPKTKNGMQNIFTIIDEFSRYVMMIPCRSKRPEEMAKLLHERWIGVIGVPESVHGDQGVELDSQRVSQICQILGIRKSRTPSYSPQSNLSELANKSIGSLLKASVFPDRRATWWVQVLQYIVMAYNETPSSVTGYKPRELIFGAIPSFYKIPLVSFEHPVVTAHEYLLATRLGQEFLWQVVRAQEMRRRKPDELGGKDHSYREGDFVLVKDLTIGRPTENKLRPRFKGPYRILKAYPASLLIQRWITPQDKLNTGPILHHHTTNARHFDARIVHPRDCKPYEEKDIGNEPRVHPKLVSNFLKQLGQLPLPFETDCPNDDAEDEVDKVDENMFLWTTQYEQEGGHEERSVDTSETIIIPTTNTLDEGAREEGVQEIATTLNTEIQNIFSTQPITTCSQVQTPTEYQEEGRSSNHRENEVVADVTVHMNETHDREMRHPQSTQQHQNSQGNNRERSHHSSNGPSIQHHNIEMHEMAEGEVERDQPNNPNNESTTTGANVTNETNADGTGIDATKETNITRINSSSNDECTQYRESTPINQINEEDFISPEQQHISTSHSPRNGSAPEKESSPLNKDGEGVLATPIQRKINTTPLPPTRQQPPRAAKRAWHENWPQVKKLVVDRDSSTDEEPVDTNKVTNVELETDLRRTAQKNTFTPDEHDVLEQGCATERLEQWVADEAQPDPASFGTLVTAHETGEIEKFLIQVDEIDIEPTKDVIMETQNEETAVDIDSNSSSEHRPSHHDYVNI